MWVTQINKGTQHLIFEVKSTLIGNCVQKHSKDQKVLMKNIRAQVLSETNNVPIALLLSQALSYNDEIA